MTYDLLRLLFGCYFDSVYMSYMWYINKAAINNFTELANSFRPTIKFTAEISDTEITFLDTCVYKGDRFKKHSILDVHTHFKPLETFQYTHFNSCHPPGVRKGFIKGEALRLLTKYTAVQCNQLAPSPPRCNPLARVNDLFQFWAVSFHTMPKCFSCLHEKRFGRV